MVATPETFLLNASKKKGIEESCVIDFQDTLLGEDIFAGVARSMPSSLEPFPCFADEMEEQAKAIEFDLLADTNNAALPGTSEPMKMLPLPVPALRVSTFDAGEQRTMIPVVQHYHQYHHTTHINAAAAAAAPVVTAAPPMQQRSAPLAAALHNADCIRAGMKSPWVGAWTGCLAGSWCNRERGHLGSCNTFATIPGLGAYLPEELAAVGLPVALELTGPLPPAAAAAALAAATAAAKATLNIQAGGNPTAAVLSAAAGLKRKVDGSSSSGGDDSLAASDNNSNNGDEAVQNSKQRLRSSKRSKAPGAHLESDRQQQDTDNETASEEHKSSMTGEAKLRSMAISPPRIIRGGKKNRKRNAAAARAAAAAAQMADSHAAALHADPSAADQLGGDKRLNGNRRAPQQWISGETTDPRTGKKVTVVPPASFCTQCAATSTPVWRAGPFGHKTLCNACGVRWMKIAPRARK